MAVLSAFSVFSSFSSSSCAASLEVRALTASETVFPGWFSVHAPIVAALDSAFASVDSNEFVIPTAKSLIVCPGWSVSQSPILAFALSAAACAVVILVSCAVFLALISAISCLLVVLSPSSAVIRVSWSASSSAWSASSAAFWAISLPFASSAALARSISAVSAVLVASVLESRPFRRFSAVVVRFSRASSRPSC